MLEFVDLRETKVYQEAKQEGWQEGWQGGWQGGLKEGETKTKAGIIPRLLSLGLTVEQIAEVVDLSPKQVQQLIEKQDKGKVDSEKLKLAAEQLSALMAEHDITEDELFDEFHQLRRQDRQQQQ